MESKSLRIYATADIPRLRYISGIILGDILGVAWEIVSDRRKLGKHPVINYSNENIPGSFRIHPDELLFETGLKEREIPVDEWNGLPCFFPVSAASDFPFDLFAASFFLVTRYEEYLGHKKDEHGRFMASSSLAGRNGFLDRPVVEYWAREFAKALLKKFPNLTFRRNEFSSLVTFDIDEPFAYLGKNVFSSIGGLIRDLTSNDGHAAERYKILVGEGKDPYEVFGYLTEKIDQHKAPCRFFFPVGDHSKFDRNPSWKNEEYRKLIREIAGRYPPGLHPSYFASFDKKLIAAENARLKAITGKAVTINRFHSVRFSMPASYTGLAACGITEDFSMGYPDAPGFRAGIARPYPFYDVSTDTPTSLKIVPFQVTDTFLFSGNIIPEQTIRSMISETRKAGGLFMSIWHNTSLLFNSDCQSKRNLFELMLRLQMQ